MKIAITSKGKELDSPLDPRFGRAVGFIIYNTEDGSNYYVDNSQNLNSMQGAGIQSAQNVCNEKVDAIISGHCGPKAFRVLSQGQVKIFLAEGATVAEAIEKFKNNELKQSQDADVEGHW